MIPKNTTDVVSQKDGCIPVSSTCVVWEGPSLPCIDLCAGDTVTSVVYKIAQKLCAIASDVTINSTTVNMGCLLEVDGTTPDNLQETIQALIVKACETSTTNNGGSSQPIIVTLPECLQYTDTNNDPVTALPVDEYAMLLANEICNLKTQVIPSMQEQIVYILAQLQELNATITQCCGDNSGSTPVDILVIPQCEIVGTPGTPIDIASAFTNLEAHYCNLSTKIGNVESLDSAISTQCFLTNELQLSGSENASMGDISGWINSPFTVADSLANLWNTVCDMRSAVKTLKGTTALSCVLVPPYNVSISFINSTSCTVSFQGHGSTALEAPSSFIITVYQYDTVTQQAVGSAIANVGGVALGTSTSKIIDTSSLDGTKKYVVKVAAAYDCGTSDPVQVIGYVKTCPTNYKIKVVSNTETTISATCNGSPVSNKQRTLTVSLVDSGGVTAVLNTKTTNITCTLKFKVQDCNLANDVYETRTITFTPNTGVQSFTYLSQENHVCIASGTCSPILRGNSAANITIENISDCDVAVGSITYS